MEGGMDTARKKTFLPHPYSHDGRRIKSIEKKGLM
jgi:hypothetical protein